MSVSRLRALYDDLVELPPAERSIRLRDAGIDETTRRRLDAMLSGTDELPAFLHGSASDLADALQPAERPAHALIGTLVGPFRVEALIGEGGSAVVYRASRPAGRGEQKVALKVLRGGLGSAGAERRFTREQAILAQLSHPNIAALVEAGIDAGGLSYIAMELVDGEPITKWAERRALGLRERLRAFIVLCRSIDAAHAALVVHCDLKPSNVLVDRNGDIKVLDFGIARLIDVGLDEEPTRTIALTPEYAAPEQYQPGSPSVAVDVHALGVMLCELLTGSRSGCRGPLLASQAVGAGGAALPAGLPGRRLLAKQLAGDLDAVIETATRREPAARYRSAGALADDVERHLLGRPLTARAASRRYRIGKFVARNRVAVAAMTVAALLLVAAVVALQLQATRAERAALVATEQAARAESMRDFVFELLAEAEPTSPRDGDITVVEAVERGITTLAADRSLESRARLELSERLAHTLAKRGDERRALALLEAALAEAQASYGDGDPLTQAIALRTANLEMQRGLHDRVRQRLDALLASPAGSPPSRLRIRALRMSAVLHSKQLQREPAIELARQAVRLSESSGDPRLLRDALSDLGVVLSNLGEGEPARQAFERVLELNIAEFGPVHEKVALALAGLGRAQRRIGELDAAEQSIRSAIAIDRAIYPGPHPVTANHLNALILVLMQKSEFGAASAAARDAVDIMVAAVGRDHQQTSFAYADVGVTLVALERFEEAIPALEQALAIRQAVSADDPATLGARTRLGYALVRAGQVERGWAELERSLAALAGRMPALAFEHAYALELATKAALAHDDLAAAAGHLDALAALIDADAVPAPGSARWLGRVDLLRARLALARAAPDAAVAALRAAAAKLERAPPDPVLRAEQALLLAAARFASGDPEAARSALEDGRARLAALPDPPPSLRALAAGMPGR